jgi:hypothetical protein
MLSAAMIALMVVMAMAAVAAGAYMVYDSRRPSEAFPAALFPAVALGVLAFVLLRAPLRVAKCRRLLDPVEAATYYFELVSQGRHSSAALALASYPKAVQRHQRLVQRWEQANPSGPATMGTIDGIHIGTPEKVAEDAALVPVKLLFGKHGGITVPGIGSITVSSTRRLELTKLLIRRKGRWFLVNGMAADRIDRSLAALLAASPKGGKPGGH